MEVGKSGKSNKPIVEKRRRQRINGCLEELRKILLDIQWKTKVSSKMEKADILETTVMLMNSLKRNNILAKECQSNELKDHCLQHYSRGFESCMRQVDRWFFWSLHSSRSKMDLKIGASRLLKHLEDSLFIEKSFYYGGRYDLLRRSAWKLDLITRKCLWLVSSGKAGCCECFGKSQDVGLSKSFGKTHAEEFVNNCVGSYCREDLESDERVELPHLDSFGYGPEISSCRIGKRNKTSVNSASNFQQIKVGPSKIKTYLNKQIHSTGKLCSSSEQDPIELLKGSRFGQVYHQVMFSHSPQDQDQVDFSRNLVISKFSKNIWRPWIV